MSYQYLFSQKRHQHAAVVLPADDKIIIIGGYHSQDTGEIVKGRFDMNWKITFTSQMMINYRWDATDS